ncbi:unnamed protein product [Brassica oleracea var. botrytis]
MISYFMTLTWGRATRKSKRKKTPTRTRIPIEDHGRFNLESPGLLLMDAYVLIELRGPGVKPERQSIWYDIGRTPFFCARCAFGYNSMKRCVEVAEKGHVKPANYLDSHQKILIGVASTGEIESEKRMTLKMKKTRMMIVRKVQKRRIRWCHGMRLSLSSSVISVIEGETSRHFSIISTLAGKESSQVSRKRKCLIDNEVIIPNK